MRLPLFILFILMVQIGLCQETTFTSRDLSVSKFIDGTLLLPETREVVPLAIIIAGYGPTDRNGNQNFMQNNSLKKLAESLSKNGIATFRYDKRIVKQIRRGNVDPNMSFDDFVSDAQDCVNYFSGAPSFSGIYIIGHGQGSLVGMLAAKEGVDGFVSVAGSGKSIDAVIKEEVNKTAPMFNDDTERIIKILKEGKTTKDYPQALGSMFDISVQPFMSSWMQYDPSNEIKQLTIPTLIANGTKDLQVSTAEAELLHEAAADSTLEIIEKMNNMMVIIEGDTLENSKSYNESHRDISSELISAIIGFIKK